jgi:hypothetical protein
MLPPVRTWWSAKARGAYDTGHGTEFAGDRASRIFVRVSFLNKAFVVGACDAVAMMSACSNAAGKTSALPARANADALIVGVEDVRQIANFEGVSPIASSSRHLSRARPRIR